MGNSCTTNGESMKDWGKNELTEEQKHHFQIYFASIENVFKKYEVKFRGKMETFVFSCIAEVEKTEIHISVSDCKRLVWKKIIKPGQFLAIKNVIDVTQQMSIRKFVRIVRNGIGEEDVVISFREEMNNSRRIMHCHVQITLNNLPVIKTSKINLKLKNLENPETEISKYFVFPLYDFYSLRTEESPDEKIKELEKILETVKSKHHRLLKRQHKKFGEEKLLKGETLQIKSQNLLLENEINIKDNRLMKENYERIQYELEKQKKHKKNNREDGINGGKGINGGESEIEGFVQEMTGEQLTNFLKELMKKLKLNNTITIKEHESITRLIKKLTSFNDALEKDHEEENKNRKNKKKKKVDEGMLLSLKSKIHQTNDIKENGNGKRKNNDDDLEELYPPNPLEPYGIFSNKNRNKNNDENDKINENNSNLNKTKMTTIMKSASFKKKVTGNINTVLNRENTRKQVLKMFDRVDGWNFDVFLLDQYTENQTLFVTCYTLFVKYDFLTKFKIPERRIVLFLREIQSGYRKNPYHNSMHAADVTQISHYFIAKGGIVDLVNDLQSLALITASLIHDYDHPGVNNQYLKSTGSYLAILYNDRSCLENHHVAHSFELLRSDQFNIFKNLTKAQYKEVRNEMIELVLATDMEHHQHIVKEFEQLLTKVFEENSDNEKPENLDLSVISSSQKNILLTLKIVIKIADVSNASREPKLYLKWAKRIETEFYEQGDREKDLGLPISPFMDRTKHSLSKLQSTFISFLLLPMLRLFIKLFPKMSFAEKHALRNLKYWKHFQNADLNNLKKFKQLLKAQGDPDEANFEIESNRY